MESALGFTTIFMFGLMVISIFKKHILINFAIFALSIGVLANYFEAGYAGFMWVFIALVAICGYELYEMTKLRW